MLFYSKKTYICTRNKQYKKEMKKIIDTRNKYKDNPRQITKKQFNLLKEHLEELGDLSGIIFCVNNKAYVGGNQRSEVMNGSEIVITERFETPTKQKTVAHGYVNYKGEKYTYREVAFTESDFKKACVVANHDGGTFDTDILANVFDISDLTEWGFEPFELGGVGAEVLKAEEDNYEMPSEIKTDIVLGDLFEIGEHRLLCGDSTDITQVEKLMNGEKADMLFTDPPYNVAFNGRSGKFDVIENDDLPDNEFEDLIDGFVSILNILKPKNYYIWCNWKFYGILQSKLEFKACIVWAKNVFGLGRGYRHQHEFCLFNGSIDSGINNESDLWEVKKDSNYVHPTQKPIELAERALNNHKNDKNIVDLFSGSGLTFIASHQLKRKCYGMELDPKYCQVIIDRMRKLDPTLIIKRNGKEI